MVNVGKNTVHASHGCVSRHFVDCGYAGLTHLTFFTKSEYCSVMCLDLPVEGWENH